MFKNINEYKWLSKSANCPNCKYNFELELRGKKTSEDSDQESD